MKKSGALPDVTFHLRERHPGVGEGNPPRWALKSSEALFADKTVILLAYLLGETPRRGRQRDSCIFRLVDKDRNRTIGPGRALFFRALSSTSVIGIT